MNGIRRKGFTLIELLISITIIALLAGLLVPVLGSARNLARGLVCKANLRGLQTGMTSFQAEHFGQANMGGGLADSWVADTHKDAAGVERGYGVWWNQPTSKTNPHTMGQANIEAGDICAHVQEPGLYVCPVARYECHEPPRGAESWPGVAYGAQYNFPGGITVPAIDRSAFEAARTYALNDLLAETTEDSVTGEVRVKTDYGVVSNGQTIWLIEVHPWRDRSRPSGGISRAHIGPNDTPATFHTGETNCSFGDGHVERLTSTEVRRRVDPATWPPPAVSAGPPAPTAP